MLNSYLYTNTKDGRGIIKDVHRLQVSHVRHSDSLVQAARQQTEPITRHRQASYCFVVRSDSTQQLSSSQHVPKANVRTTCKQNKSIISNTLNFFDKPTGRYKNASSLVKNNALNRGTVIQSEGNLIHSGVEHHDAFVVASRCDNVSRDW